MKDGIEGDTFNSQLVVVEVGTDEDGEAITSCVVEPAEASATSPAKAARLSPAQGRALQMLADAVDKAGQVPPASNHIPPSTLCVSESLWREYCYQGSISAGDQDAKQKAFKRAAEALVAAGRVGKWDGQVWLA